MSDNVVDIQLKFTADYSDVDKNITALKEQLTNAFSDFDKAMSKTNSSKLKQSISAGKDRVKALNDEILKYEQLRDKAQEAANLVNQIQGQRLRSAKKDSGVSPEQYQRLTDALTKAKAESWKMNDAFLAQRETVQGLVSEILKVTNAAYFMARKTGDKMGYGKERDDDAPPKGLKERYEAISDVLSEWDEKIRATNGDMKEMSQLAIDISKSLTGRPGAADELKQFIKMRYAELTAVNGTANAQDGVTKAVRRTAGAIKETLTTEQRAAKEALKNARNRASANYYVLRSLKMTIKEVDNLLKRTRALEASLLSAAARGLKGITRLGLGFGALRKRTESATKSHKGFIGSMKLGFMTILKYTLGIRSFYFLINKLRKALGDSMGTLATHSSLVNEQMSSLLSNLTWMKNMLATVAQPILNVLVPALDFLAKQFERVTYAVASFFATLTGQSFVYRATKGMEDYAASMDKAGKSAKKLNNNLIGLDELNVINDSSGSGDGGAAAGFEESEVLPAASALAEKVKDIFSTLFDPIETAWKAKGQFVMDSWKYALEEIRVLINTIGKDFLTVWSNDVGVQIWTDIFHIVGDVGLIVGNLAKNFTDAWTTLDVGRHILEQMQGLIATVVQGIRDCADATVEWSQKLDFYPLLQSVYNLLVAIKPAVQTIVDILSYFWTNVVLPFRTYMIEDGLPKLLDLLGQISGKIDWDLLEERMKKLMDAFEPFLEKVWEGLLLVLGDLGDKLAEIVNSDGFGYLIDKLTEFMENASPEDVAKAIEDIAKAIVAFHLALTALKTALGVIEGVRTFFNFLNQGAVLKNLKELNKAMGVEPTGFAGILKQIGSNTGDAIKGMEEIGGAADTLGSKISLFGQGLRQGFLDTLGPAKTLLAGIGLIIGGIVLVVKNFVDMLEEGFNWIDEIGVILGGVLITIGLIVAGVAALPAVIIGAIVAAVTTVAVLIHDHWEQIKEVFSGIASWFDEHVVQPLLEFLSPVIEWFKGLWQTVKDVFESIWIIIKAIAIVIFTYVKARIDTIATIFKTLWKGIKKGAKSLWTGIKNVLLTIANFIYTKVILPIKKHFGWLFEGIANGVKIALNIAIGVIEGFINFVIDAINFFLSGLEKIASVASKITGDDYSGITKIKHVNLPRLAQGAVIPPNQEFLAVLGDQKSGTNIEAPLETIQDAVALVLQPYLERLISITEDIYEKDTSVNIGDVDIARANVRGRRRLGYTLRTT